jgi:hypothetical protein
MNWPKKGIQGINEPNDTKFGAGNDLALEMAADGLDDFVGQSGME